MINKIRIWLAYRRYTKAQSIYFKSPSWRNYATMRIARRRWENLKIAHDIKPAW
jgi:hypothetical protein